MPTEQEINEALEAVNELERVEADDDHKMILAEVRRMIVGVHSMELYRDDIDQEKLETLQDVLQSIDPDDQVWHDSEYVERYKDEGLMFADIYKR